MKINLQGNSRLPSGKSAKGPSMIQVIDPPLVVKLNIKEIFTWRHVQQSYFLHQLA